MPDMTRLDGQRAARLRVALAAATAQLRLMVDAEQRLIQEMTPDALAALHAQAREAAGVVESLEEVG